MGVALPRDHTEYMRGRRRHALRTNLRRAATAGITCEVVSDRQRVDPELTGILRRHWRHLPEAELHAWTNRFRARGTRPGMTVMVVRAHEDRALAVLAATVDDSVCGIGFAMATCHEARWALHDHMVRALIARRVRYVLAGGHGPFGALAYSPNVQHYQHLLGYELRHVIPVPAHRAARRRRRLTLAALAASAALAAPASAGGAVWSSLLRSSIRRRESRPRSDAAQARRWPHRGRP